MFGGNKETQRVLDILEDFPAAVRMKRQRCSMSLRAVEASTGVGFNSIGRIENGIANPRLSSVIPLLRWLFSRSGEGE